jgi:predicted alpha/beta-hydrolase family hydrolase
MTEPAGRDIERRIGGTAVGVTVFGAGAVAVVLGHGAGGRRTTPFLVRTAQAIAASGRAALLFNFPYSEAGRRVPDPPGLLEDTSAAIGELARELGASHVVHGGKSMGGRIASQAVARGAPADGLVFLGYPLHPPGKTDVLRDRHLGAVRAPMLFFQGTRDAFARFDLIEDVTRRLGSAATLYRLEDADHSFAVRKRSGRTTGDVEREIHAALIEWLGAHGL